MACQGRSLEVGRRRGCRQPLPLSSLWTPQVIKHNTFECVVFVFVLVLRHDHRVNMRISYGRSYSSAIFAIFAPFWSDGIVRKCIHHDINEYAPNITNRIYHCRPPTHTATTYESLQQGWSSLAENVIVTGTAFQKVRRSCAHLCLYLDIGALASVRCLQCVSQHATKLGLLDRDPRATACPNHFPK